MPTLRDIFKDRELYFIRPQQTVGDVARYMTERKVGAVCVLEGDRLVGILSERDLMSRVVAASRDPETTKVSEVMTERPVLVDVNEKPERCLQLMKQANIRHLPVVEGSKLVGLVSVRDLLQVDLTEKLNELKLMQDYIHYVPPSKPRL